MTNLQANQLVGILLAAFPKSVPAETASETTKTYRALLAELDFAEAQRAVHALLKRAKFLPSIGEIHEAYDVELDAARRKREKQQSRLLAPRQTERERLELAAMARKVVEDLNRAKSAPSAKPTRHVPTYLDGSPIRTTPSRTEPCGVCKCCQADLACAHVLQLSPEDEADLERLKRIWSHR